MTQACSGISNPFPHVDDVLHLLKLHTATLTDIAQGVVDGWDFDDGGCCGLIADKICCKLDEVEGLAAYPYGEDGGEHEWVVIPTRQGIVTVDIPYEIYETRLGYCRYKPTHNKIQPEDLVVEFVDIDPYFVLDFL